MKRPDLTPQMLFLLSRLRELVALRAMGYDLSISHGHWSNGECIAVDPATGELEAGQDQRSHYGKAAGY